MQIGEATGCSCRVTPFASYIIFLTRVFLGPIAATEHRKIIFLLRTLHCSCLPDQIHSLIIFPAILVPLHHLQHSVSQSQVHQMSNPASPDWKWFPNTKDNWSLDVVTLLAVIDESSMTEYSQTITASLLCLIPRLIPAP